MREGRNGRPLPRLSAAAPQIDGETCLLGRFAASKCRACVDACPTGALIVSADGLGIDETACTGCGLCVPACPTAAVALPRPVSPRVARAGAAVFLVCRPATEAGAPRDAAVAPCLHAFGLRDLAAWRGAAARVETLRADCEGCCYGGGTRLADRAALFARLLDSRGLAPLPASDLPAAEWRRRFEQSDPAPAPGAMSRRGVLAMFAARESKPEQADGERGFLGLPTACDAALAAYGPQIDELACTGCDACARLCPTGALALTGEAYVIEPARCDNCRLCVDVCADAAIAITGEGPAARRSVALAGGRCRRCGAPFHAPTARRSETGLCRICARVDHHRNLHQVLP